MLAVVGSLTVDLYLPALPLIQHDLGISTAAAQLTLTPTTLGFALGQLIVGPWSDSVGRRTPLIASTVLHIAASIGVALSVDIHWLLAFRLLQGLGAAGGAVAAMAIVRDLFAGRTYVMMGARIAVISGLTPVIAPLFGVQLLHFMDWRGLFVVVTGYGAAMLAFAGFALTESLPRDRRLTLHPRALLARYAGLARTREFVGAAFIGGLMVSGVFTMMTASSFLLQGTYELDGQGYALTVAVNAIAFVIGTQASARIIRRVSPYTLLKPVLPAMALMGFAIIPAAHFGVVGITCATFVFMITAGMIGPSMNVIAMGSQGHQAGTAASVLGAANFGLAGITAPIVGLIGVESVVPMASLMGLTGVIAGVVFWLMVERGSSMRGRNLDELVTAVMPVNTMQPEAACDCRAT